MSSEQRVRYGVMAGVGYLIGVFAGGVVFNGTLEPLWKAVVVFGSIFLVGLSAKVGAPSNVADVGRGLDAAGPEEKQAEVAEEGK